MLSKLKCNGGESRMTPQMAAIERDSRNPLHIPEMLEHVLGFLPVKDLKSCRLVNKFWKDTALKPMRKQTRMISFAYSISDTRWLERMENFLQCFSADPGSGLLNEVRADIPCTKFHIFTHIIFNDWSSDRKKSIVGNFLHAISPWVTKIELRGAGAKDIDVLLNGMGMKIEELKFPSLKHTTYSNLEPLVHAAPPFSPWMFIFITNAPQLEKLDLKLDVGGQRMPYPSLKPFLQVLKNNQGLKINDLHISAKPIENSDLISLSECNLKLKTLHLRISNKSQLPIDFLPQLLNSQSENLENFTIDNVCGSITADVPFPKMKNLTSLTIHERCPGLINYAEQMPSLERVVFQRIKNSDWQKYLNAEMKPALGVKELCFMWWAHPTAEVIREAVRIFPNLRKLELPVDNHSVPMVYDSCPNLEELTLKFGECTSFRKSHIDGLLTGMGVEGRSFRYAFRKLRDWTPDFDDSVMEIGINHSPISVLKNLKVLRLRNGWYNQLEISQVSLCLAIMKMPSLQILDLCERGRDMVPDKLLRLGPALEEFRKNCLVLCKLF